MSESLLCYSLSDFLCCSIAREFCIDGGHTFTDQLDRVRRHCCMFNLYILNLMIPKY